jgi:Flp pilus assembly pilin Flp
VNLAIARFIREESGLETIEYSIIAGMIVVGTILTVGAIALLVSGKFAVLETTLKGAAPSGT